MNASWLGMVRKDDEPDENPWLAAAVAVLVVVGGNVLAAVFATLVLAGCVLLFRYLTGI